MRKALPKRQWRDAATLILAGRNSQTIPPSLINRHGTLYDVKQETKTVTDCQDFSFLMLQRHSKSSFMPDAYVFPGGVIDKADYSEQWLDMYKEFGYSKDDLDQFLETVGSRPPMFEFYKHNTIIPEVAFRICAIREAFEECGLMLFKSKRNGNHMLHLNNKNSFIWRQRVHKNAFAFLELCREFELLPNIWLLREWSNWLTPSSFSSKRFDTMFYICMMEHLPDVKHDEKETTNAVWGTPKQLITDHINHKIWLAPPQFYEMSRFLKFSIFQDLKEFSSAREVEGVFRLLPVRIRLQDGLVSLLPGDDSYDHVLAASEEKSLKGVDHEVEDKSTTIEEFRRKVKRLNRMEFKSRTEFNILCNQEMHGHLCHSLVPGDFLDRSDSSKL